MEVGQTVTLMVYVLLGVGEQFNVSIKTKSLCMCTRKYNQAYPSNIAYDSEILEVF